jgi:hypothetical protein
MSDHLTRLAALYAPRVPELLAQLPELRKGLVDALSALEADPRLPRANVALAQLSGAQRFLQALREAMGREEAQAPAAGGADVEAR